MKILWISPWFGNYRIPVYDNLNKLSGGNFYIICSQENTSDLVREKLKATLGDHAVIMSGEKRTTMGSEESDFANSALVIKRQPGLYKAVKDILVTRLDINDADETDQPLLPRGITRGADYYGRK